MAETIVQLVLEKITDALVKEALHLCGVGEQVEKVERELNRIKAFLKDADRKQIQDEMQKQWVKEVRDVAYRIEDVIDTFLCEIPQKKPGKREAIKRIFGKTKKLPVIHKLGDEINKILTKIQEISDMKVRYGINSLGEGGGGKRLPVRPPILPDIEDVDIVGLDADRDNIVKELLDESTPRRSVVSIVGLGGLGKTTLAKKVYNSNEIRRTFNNRIWVAISQEFELINILKKISGQIREINESEQGKDEEYFLMDLFRSLKGKKYLLVIDDVWTINLWMAIQKALPNEKNGSRILMTTRIYEVAKEADPAREPYKLSFLTEKSSLELFLKNAIPNEEIRNECPENLLALARQFANKCGGLPLALVVLGCLLAKKQFAYPIWSKMMQTMNWHADGQKVCIEIISTSYDDLPLALKSCFMYFAAFPEDYTIEDVPSLLRMWIAEGFIPQEENRTLEDTAESFLEDLVQRSLIQVAARNLYDDSIKECRIHDLLRDVAIEKAKEDSFLTACSTPDEVRRSDQARRVAVHNLNRSELMKYENSNLRTLLCFNSRTLEYSGRLLKILSEMGMMHPYKTEMLLEEFPQLRFLKLTRHERWKDRSVEKSIRGMKFLQTLVLGDIDYILPSLPDCIWHIKTLRHVILHPVAFISGPPATTNLPNLQTLRGVKNRESWEYTNLPNLPNLRELKIYINDEISWGLVVAFLHTLKKLVKLDIQRSGDIPKEVDMKDFPFYPHLIWLRYCGRLCPAFDVAMLPTNLVHVYLGGSKLHQDSLTALEKLLGLKELVLTYLTFPNPKMKCSAGGFPRLEKLFIAILIELEEWEIEKGVMPMLKCLEVRKCAKLHVPQGLQHLTTLTHLTWEFPQKDHQSDQKEKEIRHLCEHMPSVTIEIIA